MDGSTTLRRLGEPDLEVYKRLREESLQAHPSAYTSDIREALQQPAASYRARLGLDDAAGVGSFTLGAFRRERLIAALSCECDARIKVRHIAHLTAMMVRAEFAGQGVGRGLLELAVATARAMPGLEMLTLSVTHTNLAAVRLYETAGFERYGSLPNAIKVDGQAHTKDSMVLRL